MLYKTTTILEICGNFVHKILDEKFGKEGTVERAQAEEAACSFYSSQNIDFNKRDLTAELRGALTTHAPCGGTCGYWPAFLSSATCSSTMCCLAFAFYFCSLSRKCYEATRIAVSCRLG